MQGASGPGFPASAVGERAERVDARRLPVGLRLTTAAQLAGLMLAVAAAYYLGSRIGLSLRIPPATTSVMWPPNTIITLSLLLTPVRRWGWCLAAATVAHLVVQSGTDWPLPMVLGLAATNSMEAVLGAAAFRWFTGPDPRIDSLRRIATFIAVVALAAPLLSSFPDAAMVSWFRDESFVVVLRRRFVSNCLTALTLLPALLALATHAPRWLREARTPRLIEAGGLAAGFAVALKLALATNPVVGTDPLTSHPPRVIVLPFLLWASARFGTAGASLTLLGTSLAAVYDGIARAPFTTPAAAETAILNLQLFLIALSIPLLGMAALTEERYRARLQIADRLLFEAMLARLSATFVQASGTDVVQVCRAGLERIGRYFGAETVVLFERVTDAQTPRAVAAWTASTEGAASATRAPAALLEWTASEILLEREVRLDPSGETPPGAEADRTMLEAGGYRGTLAIPLASGGSVVGALAFFISAPRTPWTRDWVSRARQAAELFGHALARRQADEALRASEAMKSAILAAIAGGVAVLDRQGTIVTANAPWSVAASDRSVATIVRTASGSYLESCRDAMGEGFVPAAEVLEGVQRVLSGASSAFAFEYPAEPLSLDRWFLVSAVPLQWTEGGAVVTHTDISARKRAELAAQRSREALAQATHVSAMSELASSLAQQLSEPLTGILHSARSAQALLSVSAAAPGDVDTHLQRIMSEETRASGVIRRLCDLLWKGGAPERSRLDFNEVVQDVVRVVQNDALIQRAQIVTSLADEPLPIVGDRAQLAQVLSNLIINGMEAMAGIDPSRRQLVVATERAYGAAVFVVRDAGPGPAAESETLFEPFYTTKPTGMGMGLPIARTIAEAHGGRAWGARTPGGSGASFFVSLPLDPDAA